MRLRFTQETPLAIVTLFVCLPVAAVLAYIIIYDFADVLANPQEHRSFFIFIGGYFGGWLLAETYRHWRTKRRVNAGARDEEAGF